MIRTRNSRAHFLRGFALLLILASSGDVALADGETAPARDPKQPVDDAYTAKIKKYTTQPFFTSPLVDYLPASKTVPTPEAVLGDVAGAPGILPYAEDVYKYMRLLEKASPRVKDFLTRWGQGCPLRVAVGSGLAISGSGSRADAKPCGLDHHRGSRPSRRRQCSNRVHRRSTDR